MLNFHFSIITESTFGGRNFSNDSDCEIHLIYYLKCLSSKAIPNSGYKLFQFVVNIP